MAYWSSCGATQVRPPTLPHSVILSLLEYLWLIIKLAVPVRSVEIILKNGTTFGRLQPRGLESGRQEGSASRIEAATTVGGALGMENAGASSEVLFLQVYFFIDWHSYTNGTTDANDPNYVAKFKPSNGLIIQKYHLPPGIESRKPVWQ